MFINTETIIPTHNKQTISIQKACKQCEVNLVLILEISCFFIQLLASATDFSPEDGATIVSYSLGFMKYLE